MTEVRLTTSSFVTRVRGGMAQPRVAICLKVIAVIMLLSALSHLGSILGMRGTSWAAKPLHFRD